MTASASLQKAVIAAMKAHAGLTALVGTRIYDEPPRQPEPPYITLGPSDFYPERQDGFARRVETFQVDVWDQTQRRKKPCKDIVDQVVLALDMANLIIAGPYTLARLELRLARVMSDPDGITKHGVVQFEAEVNGG